MVTHNGKRSLTLQRLVTVVGQQAYTHLIGMAYKKLSEQEKQEILQQLQQETATISDLASRYGVSQTTIRRLKGADPTPTIEETPSDLLAFASATDTAGTSLSLTEFFDAPTH
jgi:hypothetical protein